MSKFANRLISLRKERNLTQEDIAKIIYKKRSTVSGYETEGKQPDLDTVCLLAKYFGVSTDYLLGYTDRPNHSEDVFYNDTVNFQKHFNNLPTELRPAVSKCFDDFYRAPKPGYAVRSPGAYRSLRGTAAYLGSRSALKSKRRLKLPAVRLQTPLCCLTSWPYSPSSKMRLPLCLTGSCKPIWKSLLTSRTA